MSLCALAPYVLGNLLAAAYINLHRAGTQVHQGFLFQIAACGTPLSGPRKVAPKRTNRATDGDMTSPMRAKLELLNHAPDLHPDDDKDLQLA